MDDGWTAEGFAGFSFIRSSSLPFTPSRAHIALISQLVIHTTETHDLNLQSALEFEFKISRRRSQVHVTLEENSKLMHELN